LCTILLPRLLVHLCEQRAVRSAGLLLHLSKQQPHSLHVCPHLQVFPGSQEAVRHGRRTGGRREQQRAKPATATANSVTGSCCSQGPLHTCVPGSSSELAEGPTCNQSIHCLRPVQLTCLCPVLTNTPGLCPVPQHTNTCRPPCLAQQTRSSGKSALRSGRGAASMQPWRRGW
jgi:hypothetical protein